MVGRVGEPADAPADADGGRDAAHGGQSRHAGQHLVGRAGVGPVDVELGPGHDAHGDEHQHRGRHRPLLEGGNRTVTDVADDHLDGHDGRGSRETPPEILGARIDPAELAEQRHHEVRMIQVLTAVQPTANAAWMAAGGYAPCRPEGSARKHHARDAGALTEQHEGTESEHADQVADDQNGNGVGQRQSEVDAEALPGSS